MRLFPKPPPMPPTSSSFPLARSSRLSRRSCYGSGHGSALLGAFVSIQPESYRRSRSRASLLCPDASTAKVCKELYVAPAVTSPVPTAALLTELGSLVLKTVEFPVGTRDVSAFDESDGTMRMFCASGKIATVLDEGGVLVADELDASLHTSLFEEIVRLFMTPATNPKGAQLVFSAQTPTCSARRSCVGTRYGSRTSTIAGPPTSTRFRTTRRARTSRSQSGTSWVVTRQCP